MDSYSDEGSNHLEDSEYVPSIFSATHSSQGRSRLIKKKIEPPLQLSAEHQDVIALLNRRNPRDVTASSAGASSRILLEGGVGADEEEPVKEESQLNQTVTRRRKIKTKKKKKKVKNSFDQTIGFIDEEEAREPKKELPVVHEEQKEAGEPISSAHQPAQATENSKNQLQELPDSSKHQQNRVTFNENEVVTTEDKPPPGERTRIMRSKKKKKQLRPSQSNQSMMHREERPDSFLTSGGHRPNEILDQQDLLDSRPTAAAVGNSHQIPPPASILHEESKEPKIEAIEDQYEDRLPSEGNRGSMISRSNSRPLPMGSLVLNQQESHASKAAQSQVTAKAPTQQNQYRGSFHQMSSSSGNAQSQQTNIVPQAPSAVTQASRAATVSTAYQDNNLKLEEKSPERPPPSHIEVASSQERGGQQYFLPQDDADPMSSSPEPPGSIIKSSIIEESIPRGNPSPGVREALLETEGPIKSSVQEIEDDYTDVLGDSELPQSPMKESFALRESPKEAASGLPGGGFESNLRTSSKGMYLAAFKPPEQIQKKLSGLPQPLSRSGSQVNPSNPSHRSQSKGSRLSQGGSRASHRNQYTLQALDSMNQSRKSMKSGKSLRKQISKISQQCEDQIKQSNQDLLDSLHPSVVPDMEGGEPVNYRDRPPYGLSNPPAGEGTASFRHQHDILGSSGAPPKQILEGGGMNSQIQLQPSAPEIGEELKISVEDIMEKNEKFELPPDDDYDEYADDRFDPASEKKSPFQSIIKPVPTDLMNTIPEDGRNLGQASNSLVQSQSSKKFGSATNLQIPVNQVQQQIPPQHLPARSISVAANSERPQYAKQGQTLQEVQNLLFRIKRFNNKDLRPQNEFEVKEEKKVIASHLVDLSNALNHLVSNQESLFGESSQAQRLQPNYSGTLPTGADAAQGPKGLSGGATLHATQSLPEIKIMKKRAGRSDPKFLPPKAPLQASASGSRLSTTQKKNLTLNLKEMQSGRPGMPLGFYTQKKPSKKRYLDQFLGVEPSARLVDKELYNCQIKIQNMKNDYTRLRKLISKIHVKSGGTYRSSSRKRIKKRKPTLQQAQSLAEIQKKQDLDAMTEDDRELFELNQMEEQFSITGVNQYKTQLESSILELTKKVKDLRKKNHEAEIYQKRLGKEHTEKVLFINNEERDKGMGALRQLEHLKVKIETINFTLRRNLQRKKENAQNITGLITQIQKDQEQLEAIPSPAMTQQQINMRAEELKNQIQKVEAQRILRERTLRMQLTENQKKIKSFQESQEL